MSKKKVLVWETLATVSGGQKMTLTVIDMLSDKYDFCCMIPDKGMLSNELEKRKIPYVLVGDQTLPTGIKGKKVIFRYAWMSVRNIFRSLKQIRTFKPDILYCPGPAALPWSAVCGSLTGKPVIWHLHHIFMDKATMRLLNICGKWRCVRNIIAVSNCVGEQIANKPAQDKVVVLYNPVDVQKFANGNPDKFLAEVEQALNRKNIREDVLLLTHIGAISKNKCQELFVRTVYEIKNRGIDVIGLIIGNVVTDADRDYLNTINSFISTRELEMNIYSPGFRCDIAEILAATDCVVVPSSEGMPLTVLEALSAKTHVVGMDQGGSKEVLISAGCGELFPADGTAVDVADAVLKAVKQGDNKLESGFQFCLQQSFENYSLALHRLFSVINDD